MPRAKSSRSRSVIPSWAKPTNCARVWAKIFPARLILRISSGVFTPTPNEDCVDLFLMVYNKGCSRVILIVKSKELPEFKFIIFVMVWGFIRAIALIWREYLYGQYRVPARR